MVVYPDQNKFKDQPYSNLAYTEYYISPSPITKKNETWTLFRATFQRGTMVLSVAPPLLLLRPLRQNSKMEGKKAREMHGAGSQ
jgi:hypothetical protein